MRAALITGARTVELLEFPAPTPAPGGVVVDVSFCGICGTDVHAFESGRPYTPAICGHEWAGVVSAVGGEVDSLQEGDRVVVGLPPACGTCDACSAGHARYCETAFRFARGRDELAPPHGGFAPQLAVSAQRVIRAHDALTDEQLAQVEPATIAYHAVARSRLRDGDLAVVQGAGPIGLATMQWARDGGAGTIVVVEPDAARRDLALALGADAAVEPDDAADTIAGCDRGLGADVVYECVGRPDTLQAAVDMARRGGAVCLIGLSSEPVTIDAGSWLVKEITVTGSIAYVHADFDHVMTAMAEGRVRLDELHSLTVGLDGLADALDDLAHGRTGQAKVLVNPNWSCASR
ncbi:MAG: zinc-binding dehydrogenase [Acidimicrobiales bacterium]|nr:zinc-binding dehydrogenase [Acidimicrobiales bacterium]